MATFQFFHLCLVAQCSEEGVPGSPLVLFALLLPCEVRRRWQLPFLLGLPKCDGGEGCQPSQEVVLRVGLYRWQTMALFPLPRALDTNFLQFSGLVSSNVRQGDCGSTCGHWAAGLGLQLAEVCIRTWPKTCHQGQSDKFESPDSSEALLCSSLLYYSLSPASSLGHGYQYQIWNILSCQNQSCCLVFLIFGAFMLHSICFY